MTQVLTLGLKRSVDMMVLNATLSWALLVDAFGWNFLVDKPPQRSKGVSSRETATVKLIPEVVTNSMKRRIRGCLEDSSSDQGSSKNTRIPSIKTLVNIARRNHYLDSHYILMVMVPEMMTRTICCKNSE